MTRIRRENDGPKPAFYVRLSDEIDLVEAKKRLEAENRKRGIGIAVSMAAELDSNLAGKLRTSILKA